MFSSNTIDINFHCFIAECDLVFPASIINGVAVSKTFQILYRNEDVIINDIIQFKIHLLTDAIKVTLGNCNVKKVSWRGLQGSSLSGIGRNQTSFCKVDSFYYVFLLSECNKLFYCLNFPLTVDAILEILAKAKLLHKLQ